MKLQGAHAIVFFPYTQIKKKKAGGKESYNIKNILQACVGILQQFFKITITLSVNNQSLYSESPPSSIPF